MELPISFGGVLDLAVLLLSLCAIGAVKRGGSGGGGWRKLLGLGGGKKEDERNSRADAAAAAGDWERAAKIFEEDGRFRDAARIYQSKGHNHGRGPGFCSAREP